MTRAEKGDRVIAIVSADDQQVQLLGYGTYEGYPEPPGGIPDLPTPEAFDAYFSSPEWQVFEEKNFEKILAGEQPGGPRIRLDSGQEVYGSWCWWGPASREEEIFSGREVVQVDVDAFVEKGWEAERTRAVRMAI